MQGRSQTESRGSWNHFLPHISQGTRDYQKRKWITDEDEESGEYSGPWRVFLQTVQIETEWRRDSVLVTGHYCDGASLQPRCWTTGVTCVTCSCWMWCHHLSFYRLQTTQQIISWFCFNLFNDSHFFFTFKITNKSGAVLFFCPIFLLIEWMFFLFPLSKIKTKLSLVFSAWTLLNWEHKQRTNPGN